eukprot:14943504-Alexandrium_andersonii.AAC.1
MAGAAGGPASRHRFPGTPIALADAIDAACGHLGRSWCRYPDEGGVHPEKIAEHHQLLSVLRDLTPNLSFPKTCVEVACKYLLERHAGHEGWYIAPEHTKAYACLLYTSDAADDM